MWKKLSILAVAATLVACGGNDDAALTDTGALATPPAPAPIPSVTPTDTGVMDSAMRDSMMRDSVMRDSIARDTTRDTTPTPPPR